MTAYLEGVLLLNFVIDFLLLLAAGKLCGFPTRVVRITLAGVIGGVYAAFCLVPGFAFMGKFIWRVVSLGVISLVAYGCSVGALRRGVVFSVLCFALGGVAMGIGRGGILGVVCTSGVLCVLCCIGVSGKIGTSRYIPIELHYSGKRLLLTALIDTGNTLRDPVTGQQVLVIGADAAKKLTGLTDAQLHKPVESLNAIPGLRLIPYRSVGASGFLLALRLQEVRIGGRRGSTVVAFAPESLGDANAYQALIGGMV